MHRFSTIVVIVFFVISCASGHRMTSEKLRRHVTAGEYDKAIEVLKESALAKDEKSQLLHAIELGLLQHYQGHYEESSLTLTKARALVDELYTTRVSGKLSSVINNDNSDFYYGEKYEASLVFFYLALNSYMQAVAEPDAVKRKTLFLRARAEVLDWDSFLSEIKKERLGKAVFKDDLLAKVFGALVHESQETKVDSQIALQLYKDAQEVFFKNYNLYPSFNASYLEFKKNFDLFPTIPKAEVVGKYVLETPHSHAFKTFLETKIKSLSATSKGTEGRVSFLIQDGLIAEKVPQRYELPMVWGVHATAALNLGVAQTVSFELPTIDGVEKLETGKIQALNEAGVVVKESQLLVVAPLGELAAEAISEHSTAVEAKTAARVVGKHVAALVGSIAVYEAGKRQNNSMTMLLAMAGHAASVAAINESEKADTRFWSTLPSSIRMGEMSLPPGSYTFQAVYDSPPATRIIPLGSRTIKTAAPEFVMSNKDLRFKGQIQQTPVTVQRSVSGKKN